MKNFTRTLLNITRLLCDINKATRLLKTVTVKFQDSNGYRYASVTLEYTVDSYMCLLLHHNGNTVMLK